MLYCDNKYESLTCHPSCSSCQLTMTNVYYIPISDFRLFRSWFIQCGDVVLRIRLLQRNHRIHSVLFFLGHSESAAMGTL